MLVMLTTLPVLLYDQLLASRVHRTQLPAYSPALVPLLSSPPFVQSLLSSPLLVNKCCRMVIFTTVPLRLYRRYYPERYKGPYRSPVLLVTPRDLCTVYSLKRTPQGLRNTLHSPANQRLSRGSRETRQPIRSQQRDMY